MALFGADLVIAGATKRSIARLALGYWDAADTQASGLSTAAPAPANALTGGVHGHVDPVGAGHGVKP